MHGYNSVEQSLDIYISMIERNLMCAKYCTCTYLIMFAVRHLTW